MKLKKKLTTGNMLDFEDVFFVDEETEQQGTYHVTERAVRAAISGGWFSDIENGADPTTVIRAIDSDEFLEVAGAIIDIYQKKKIAETVPDPNS